MTRAYDEIIDFIAGGCRTDEVAKFQPSQESRERVAWLLAASKRDALTPEESSELDSYVTLEHIMSMAKARARERMSREALQPSN